MKELFRFRITGFQHHGFNYMYKEEKIGLFFWSSDYMSLFPCCHSWCSYS